MELTLFEKFGVIFKYIFSSALSIEIFIISVLLLAFLIINSKKNNVFFQLVTIGIFIGFVIGILISYTTYVKTCIDSFIKSVLNYIYFPSSVVYFFIMIFVTTMVLYTVFSKEMSIFKKIFNYTFFCILYFFFMSFVALATKDGVDLINTSLLYKNTVILAIVQISNLLLLIWFVFTCFYNLYFYLKKKYD